MQAGMSRCSLLLWPARAAGRRGAGQSSCGGGCRSRRRRALLQAAGGGGCVDALLLLQAVGGGRGMKGARDRGAVSLLAAWKGLEAWKGEGQALARRPVEKPRSFSRVKVSARLLAALAWPGRLNRACHVAPRGVRVCAVLEDQEGRPASPHRRRAEGVRTLCNGVVAGTNFRAGGDRTPRVARANSPPGVHRRAFWLVEPARG